MATRRTSTRDLERIEAEAWGDVHRAASGEAAVICGVSLRTIASATACVAGKVDVLAFNRTLGLGLDEPATEAAVDELVETYRSAGAARFFVQLCPEAEPGAVAEWLTRRGFRIHNRWVKLWRGVDDPPDAESDLRIACIGLEHARAFATVASDCLGWPTTVRSWIERTVGRPGWRHYLALDGDAPVATAAMFEQEGLGWLDFAATLPDHRGRGAQAALLARRIRDAGELGVRRLVVETAEPTPGRGAPSFRNVSRLGFHVAYVRPNYLLDLGAEGGTAR